MTGAAPLAGAMLAAAAVGETLGLAGIAVGLRRRGRSLADLGVGRPTSMWNYALALVIAALYCAAAWWNPAVAAWAFRAAPLKAVALLAALAAGAFEEVFFRGWLMDFLQRRGARTWLQCC